ncbi:hypothetical protein ACN28S_06895 [Cystobacter fuscus]
MLVIGTPEAAFLWPLATLTPPDTEQMVISAKLVHPAWKKRKPTFSSDSYLLEAAEPFELSAVREGTRKSFKVSISKPGAASPEWKDVEVQVKAVPWHSQLVPNSATVPRLLYRVFGSPGATFLVHELSGSPDFHHVVLVRFEDRRFTQEELSRGLLVDVEDRPNVKGAKLQVGDAPKGSRLDDKPVKFKVERELPVPRGRSSLTSSTTPAVPSPGESPAVFLQADGHSGVETQSEQVGSVMVRGCSMAASAARSREWPGSSPRWTSSTRGWW